MGFLPERIVKGESVESSDRKADLAGTVTGCDFAPIDALCWISYSRCIVAGKTLSLLSRVGMMGQLSFTFWGALEVSRRRRQVRYPKPPTGQIQPV